MERRPLPICSNCGFFLFDSSWPSGRTPGFCRCAISANGARVVLGGWGHHETLSPGLARLVDTATGQPIGPPLALPGLTAAGASRGSSSSKLNRARAGQRRPRLPLLRGFLTRSDRSNHHANQLFRFNGKLLGGNRSPVAQFYPVIASSRTDRLSVAEALWDGKEAPILLDGTVPGFARANGKRSVIGVDVSGGSSRTSACRDHDISSCDRNGVPEKVPL